MLKYVYLSPAHFRTFLLGRGLARAAEAVLGAILTLAAGLAVFPELRAALNVGSVSWGWLPVYALLGVALLAALGLLLAGAVLNTTRHGMFLSEGVAGVLYLLSGAVFPVSVLPGWLRPLSLALPTTYWLEGMRRALLGPAGDLGSPLADWGNGLLALALAVGTAVLWAAAQAFFTWGERRAWRLGKLDETSGV
jgi:ABC-2 type transport system permease protein